MLVIAIACADLLTLLVALFHHVKGPIDYSLIQLDNAFR